MKTLLLLVSLAACGAAPTNQELWCAEHACNTEPGAFTTDDEHADLLAVALDNINEATGAGLRMSDKGSSVLWEPVVMGSKGFPVCGITEVARWSDKVVSTEVVIASEHVEGCTPQWSVIRHEIMCHALNASEGHTLTGVCSEFGSGEETIDDISAVWMLN
jgi:hypothetical protein